MTSQISRSESLGLLSLEILQIIVCSKTITDEIKLPERIFKTATEIKYNSDTFHRSEDILSNEKKNFINIE